MRDEGDGVLLVRVEAPMPEQAERELHLYVAGWRALNEGVEVEIEPS